MTRSGLLRILAWALLAGLLFVTLSPIDLRPVSPLPVQLERALAVALVGFVFALAHPRRTLLVTALLLGALVGLELLQLAAPSRHGRIVDLAVKLAGAGSGLVVGWLLPRFHARRTSADPPRQPDR